MLKRTLLIFQLCLSFSLLLYFLGFSFFGSHFFYQSELLLVESAMGNQELLSRLSPDRAESSRESALYKKENFPLLSESDKQLLLSRKQAITDYFSSGILQKFAKSFLFYLSIPLLLWIWIVLATVLSIYLLLGNRSAARLLFLLPICAALYGITNSIYGVFPPEMKLFPSESALIKLNSDQNLESAWELYLLEKWGNPGENNKKQLALAEQKFQIEWLKLKSGDPTSVFKEKINPYFLLLFFLWNFYFALAVKPKENKS